MNTQVQKSEMRLLVDKTKLLVAIGVVLPFACGVSTTVANLVSLLELIVLILLFNEDEFWVLTPVLYIFMPQLLLLGDSLSLFNVYSLICVFKLVKEVRFISLKDNKSTLIMFGLILYSAVVCFVWRTAWEAIVLSIQACALLCAVLSVKARPHITKQLHIVFVVACLISAMYGIVFKNIIGDYEISSGMIQSNARYAGSSGDPNYMAFYYCIAICYLLFMKGIRTRHKLIGFILLFIAMALTGSLTGLLTVVVILLLYILLERETSRFGKLISIAITIAGVVFFLSYIFSDKYTIDFLETYKYRILQRIQYSHEGAGISKITSGRADIQFGYLKYFFGKSILRILFGGYQINNQGLDGEPIKLLLDAPHNTYIDVLMTCGVLGLALFVSAIVRNIHNYWKAWKAGSDDALTGLIYSCASSVFIFGLSVFPGARYFYFLML